MIQWYDLILRYYLKEQALIAYYKLQNPNLLSQRSYFHYTIPRCKLQTCLILIHYTETAVLAGVDCCCREVQKNKQKKKRMVVQQ